MTNPPATKTPIKPTVRTGKKGGLDEASIDTFADYVRTMKGPDAQVTVAGILGLVPPPGCGTAVIDTWRTAQFVADFGTDGITAYCTNDYATTLERISGHLVGARCSFALTHTLDFSRPLTILLNGTRWPWVFHPADASAPSGSIEFTPCPPNGGQVVITYDDVCQPGG